ncbi:MAG: LuxR family transcriptional regulator [Coriobacteriaceae bacterium]|nr:LuxR family transcriptional regulator [Coriobacteriaceae bacterium]
MGIKMPRISFQVDYDNKESSSGELRLLSLGYGLHETWVYVSMFAASAAFGSQAISTNGFSSNYITTAFLVSIFVFGVYLLVAGCLDKRFEVLCSYRPTTPCAALLMCVGTALLFISPLSSSMMVFLEVISGIMTGLGSGTLILYWGRLFAQEEPNTIILNSALAIAIAFLLYTVIFCNLPFPVGGIVVACLPLLEMLILMRLKNHPGRQQSVPRFRHLPLNRGRFALRFITPVLVFGLALGFIRQTSLQSVLTTSSGLAQFLIIAAACVAAAVLLIIGTLMEGRNRTSRFFQLLVPILAVAVFCLLFLDEGGLNWASVLLLIGYICFEATMWIYFGLQSQSFRLSPIMVYGFGRGALAVGAAIIGLVFLLVPDLTEMLPYGTSIFVIVMLIILFIAYILLPDERTIMQIVHPERADEKEGTDVVSGDGAGNCDVALQDGSETSLTPDEDVEEPHYPGGMPPSPAQQDADANQPESAVDMAAHEINPEMTQMEDEFGRNFCAQCESVADTYLLSQRETEVMFFLARGFNSAYIQEKLFISEGTAKTHVRHIYRKLNIHSQQELMRIVAETEV